MSNCWLSWILKLDARATIGGVFFFLLIFFPFHFQHSVTTVEIPNDSVRISHERSLALNLANTNEHTVASGSDPGFHVDYNRSPKANDSHDSISSIDLMDRYQTNGKEQGVKDPSIGYQAKLHTSKQTRYIQQIDQQFLLTTKGSILNGSVLHIPDNYNICAGGRVSSLDKSIFNDLNIPGPRETQERPLALIPDIIGNTELKTPDWQADCNDQGAKVPSMNFQAGTSTANSNIFAGEGDRSFTNSAGLVDNTTRNRSCNSDCNFPVPRELVYNKSSTNSDIF